MISYTGKALTVENIYNTNIIIADYTNGNDENTNGGSYVLRAQFRHPETGVYLYREVWSFHGDLEDYPEWETVSLVEYGKLLKEAVASYEALFCA